MHLHNLLLSLLLSLPGLLQRAHALVTQQTMRNLTTLTNECRERINVSEDERDRERAATFFVNSNGKGGLALGEGVEQKVLAISSSSGVHDDEEEVEEVSYCYFFAIVIHSNMNAWLVSWLMSGAHAQTVAAALRILCAELLVELEKDGVVLEEEVCMSTSSPTYPALICPSPSIPSHLC